MKRTIIPVISLICIILLQVSCVNKPVNPDNVGLWVIHLNLQQKKCRNISIVENWPVFRIDL